MKFIRVGQRYIAIDQITDAYANSDGSVIVSFVMGSVYDITFKGDEAAALINWLDQNAEHVWLAPVKSEASERRSS